MDYVLEYHAISGSWTILTRPAGESYWTQACKWYKNRAYAERKLAEIRKGKNE